MPGLESHGNWLVYSFSKYQNLRQQHSIHHWVKTHRRKFRQFIPNYSFLIPNSTVHYQYRGLKATAIDRSILFQNIWISNNNSQFFTGLKPTDKSLDNSFLIIHSSFPIQLFTNNAGAWKPRQLIGIYFFKPSEFQIITVNFSLGWNPQTRV